MFNLGRYVVRYRKAIIVFYLLLIIPAAVGYLATGVNYDLLSYMPDDLNSKQGEQILEEEFATSGLGLLMARDKKLHEVENLAGNLESIRGIDEVIWLGDYSDIYMPQEFIDPQIRDRFVSDDTALLQIQFIENARSVETNKAVEEIRALIKNDENLFLGGEPAILSDMQSALDEEILIYTAIAVAMILIVLTLSCSLYLDPFLFLISVGVAIAINMGTNFFQGDISFITASIAAVMQLGISLDYAIFLMHRFEEEKDRHENIEEAMATTINKTAVTIASSALTTFGGFAALTIMQNGIGRDMGLVLGKGIAVSLLVTLTLLPGLILAFYHFSSRYSHRVVLPSFKTISRWLIKYRWAFVVVFLVAAVPAYLAQKEVNYYYSNIHYLPRNSDAAAATEEIMEQYGTVDIVYLITPDLGRQKEHGLAAQVKNIEQVDSVVAFSELVDPALPEMVVPPELIDEFRSGDYRSMMVFLAPFETEKEVFAAVDMIRKTADALHEDYYVSGSPALTRDMAAISEVDARRVALASVAAIGLIVAASFKSMFLPLILVFAVQLAIWINLGALYFQEQTVSSLTPIIIGAIQLGATVDYAILFTLRYRENMELFDGRFEAAKKTIEDTGRSILTSALILFSATFSISVIAGISATREMTMLIGRGALTSMLVIFTFLPAILLIGEKLIACSTLNWPALANGRRHSSKKSPGGFNDNW